MARIKKGADTAAIEIFKSNLKDLLLAVRAGPRDMIGLDPGIRTGVKEAGPTTRASCLLVGVAM